MFALSLTVCETLAEQEKCQKFEHENGDQGQRVAELDLRHSTGNVRIHIGEFFGILGILEHRLSKSNTKRERVMTIGKIYKADLPNKM